jgi:hypothetical protein
MSKRSDEFMAFVENCLQIKKGEALLSIMNLEERNRARDY